MIPLPLRAENLRERIAGTIEKAKVETRPIYRLLLDRSLDRDFLELDTIVGLLQRQKNLHAEAAAIAKLSEWQGFPRPWGVRSSNPIINPGSVIPLESPRPRA